MKSISARRTAAATIIAVRVHRDPRDRERNALLAAPTTRSEAAQSGTDGKTNDSVQPQTGSKINAGFPSADFRGGDNPADHPGMSRAPQYDGPSTIEAFGPSARSCATSTRRCRSHSRAPHCCSCSRRVASRSCGARLVPRPGRSD